MPRPCRRRLVELNPQVIFFKPAGLKLKELDETVLLVEELEAIRNKDLLGLEQEECAAKMGVSQPTFHRILKTARHKVADALVNGKAIRIEGGNFRLRRRMHGGWGDLRDQETF